MDTHDFHPHPSYMAWTIDGIITSIFDIKLLRSYGFSLPTLSDWFNSTTTAPHPDYHALNRMPEFKDEIKLRFLGQNIYRLRSKMFCDGARTTVLEY